MWYDDRQVSRRTKRALIKKWFRWVTAAVRRENVDVLAHPGVLLSREGPDLRFEAEILERFTDLFGVMRAQGVAFEINEQVKLKLLSQDQLDTYHNLPALAGELGVKFSVGSDSHGLSQIGQLEWANGIARRAGLQVDDFSLHDGLGLVKGPPKPKSL
jgi:histidinol phosphatase-like PHP family hydrolase